MDVGFSDGRGADCLGLLLGLNVYSYTGIIPVEVKHFVEDSRTFSHFYS
jgi:hypothetical protein